MVKTRSPLTCWRLRNSSANVAAVLHSKNYVSDEEEESGGECLGDNTCYCKEGVIKPSLFERPRDCLGERVAKFHLEDETNEKLKKYNKRNEEEQRRKKVNTNKYGRTSIFYDNQKTCKFNDGSKSRKEVNNRSREYQNNDEQRNNEKIDRGNEELLRLPSFHEDVESIRFETYRKESPPPSESVYNSSRLEEIDNFRKKHFFETHSVEDLTKTIPDHTCVHRFELDNRFLPKPLNADEYGTSRCTICSKPMEESKIPQTTTSPEIFPKFYKYGLAPRKIYIGNGNVKLEMVGGEIEDILRRAKAKRPNYHDTYALRYQRGVNF